MSPPPQPSTPSSVTATLALSEASDHFGPSMDLLFQTSLSSKRTAHARYINVPNSSQLNTKLTNDHGPIVRSKTVYFTRHGQGFHNLLADTYKKHGVNWTQFSLDLSSNPYIQPEVTDSPLTQLGRDQAMGLRGFTEGGGRVEIVLCSPMCRAVQTAVLAYSHLIDRGGDGREEKGKRKFEAYEDIREETGVHVCDKRRPLSSIAFDYPMVDFTSIPDDLDTLFDANVRETKASIGVRIGRFVNETLFEREEESVGVVSHSGWLVTLFNGVVIVSDEVEEAGGEVEVEAEAGEKRKRGEEGEKKKKKKSLKEWFGTGEQRGVTMEWRDKL